MPDPCSKEVGAIVINQVERSHTRPGMETAVVNTIAQAILV